MPAYPIKDKLAFSYSFLLILHLKHLSTAKVYLLWVLSLKLIQVQRDS